MNATKRKFNTLLNGIGNKSTTSLASTKDVNNDVTSPANSPDSQSKKRRTSSSHSDALSKALPSTITPVKPHGKSLVAKLSSGTAMSHRKSLSSATAALDTSTPKYAPWDRGEFLKRLKSFSSLADWTPKPARVNEVEWAKRGWICQKSERVRCCLCHVEILVGLNKKEVDGKEEPVYVAQNIDALVDKYVELIITSHDEDCLWRQRGCDDSIFKLPLTHAPTALETLRERYNQISSRKDNLPYIFNMKSPPELDLDLVLSYLPSNFFGDSGARVNRVAFTMALFGWEGHAHERLGDQPDSVSCHACFRVLGLWLFKSKEVNAAGEETVGAVVNNLDPITEHRDYCPWRNSASQNGLRALKTGSTALPGWETLMRVLKNDYYLRTGKERVSTPKKGTAAAVTADVTGVDSEGNLDEAEDSKSRDEKDKERWARLRRVKSLFDTKAGKRKSMSEKGK